MKAQNLVAEPEHPFLESAIWRNRRDVITNLLVWLAAVLDKAR